MEGVWFVRLVFHLVKARSNETLGKTPHLAYCLGSLDPFLAPQWQLQDIDIVYSFENSIANNIC